MTTAGRIVPLQTTAKWQDPATETIQKPPKALHKRTNCHYGTECERPIADVSSNKSAKYKKTIQPDPQGPDQQEYNNQEKFTNTTHV